MKTKITELLGIEYPIVQGAMAWIAEHHLAAAVSKAGGLGIIAGGAAPVDYIRDEIRKARAITDKPLGMNIMLLSPNADDLAQLAIDEKIEVLTTGAGNPGKYMESWKNAGIKVMPVVASVALAKRMERAGADAVIAEGMEGGGHIGELTTMPLVPQVVDALSIPVIAAGGIADGRGMAAAFMLGAEGVQCGTVFLATDECYISDKYKELVLKATDISTVVTGRPSGHPVRLAQDPNGAQVPRTGEDRYRAVARGAGGCDRGLAAQGCAGRQLRGRHLYVRPDRGHAQGAAPVRGCHQGHDR